MLQKITSHTSKKSIGLVAFILMFVFCQASTYAAMTLTHTEFAMPDGISQPQSIIEGSDGNMWFWAQRTGGRAYGKITPDGAITTFNAPGIVATLHAVDNDGNIWFTDAGGDIYGYIEPDGTLQTFNRPFDSLPNSIVVDDAGNVWIAERAGRILFIAPGQPVITFSPAINPTKLIIGPDGTVWYSGIANGRIFSITPNGVSTEVINLANNGFVLNQMIAPDPSDGNILASVNPPNGRIVKIGTSGIVGEYDLLQNDGIALASSANTKGPDNRLWYSGSNGSANGYGYMDAGWNFITMNTTKMIQSFATQCDRLWYASTTTNVIGYISGIVSGMDCPWSPSGGGETGGEPGGSGGSGGVGTNESSVRPPSTGYGSPSSVSLILFYSMLVCGAASIGIFVYARHMHKRTL